MPNKIWVTSDLHLGHNREFLYGPRGFSHIQEHDAAIVENWNELVAPDDEVYVLGDLMLMDNERGMRQLARLNGNLHIVLGNHDTAERVHLYGTLPRTVEIESGLPLKALGHRFYLSHYPSLVSNWDDGKPLRGGVINLCGHTHNNDPWLHASLGRIYHVELDAHNNKPASLEKIIADMEKRYDTI